MELDNIQEQFFFSTIRIQTENEDEGYVSIGTGFIIHAPLQDDKTKAGLFLVSNRHVLKDPNNKITLRFHKADGKQKLVFGESKEQGV